MSRLTPTPRESLFDDPRALPFSRPPSPKLFPKQIGFIGLGNIGFQMAKNLAKREQGPEQAATPLMIWNRTVSKSNQLLDLVGPRQASIASSPEQMAIECDVIIVNLANDDVVRAIYHRLTEALRGTPPERAKIFVETSTIYPSLAGELDTMVSSIPNTRLITSPVLGTPLVADKSELILLMSGSYQAKKEMAWLLVPAVGKKVIDLGGDLEKALTFKLIANSLILGQLEVMAEAFTFAEKSGVGEEHVHALIKDYFPAPSILAYADKLTNEKFDGTQGFNIDGGIKDATHIRRLTAKHNCPMPTVDVAHHSLVTARAHHNRMQREGEASWPILDWSGLIAGPRLAAGLNGFGKEQDENLVAAESEYY